MTRLACQHDHHPFHRLHASLYSTIEAVLEQCAAHATSHLHLGEDVGSAVLGLRRSGCREEKSTDRLSARESYRFGALGLADGALSSGHNVGSAFGCVMLLQPLPACLPAACLAFGPARGHDAIKSNGPCSCRAPHEPLAPRPRRHHHRLASLHGYHSTIYPVLFFE